MTDTTHTTPRQAIEQAVLFLAGRCDGAQQRDGAGFNRYDAPAGHKLADAIASGQTIDATYALRVASKYRRQLERAGLVIPSADAVRETASQQPAQPPQWDGVSVSRVGQQVVLAFRYDPDLVEKARALPGRKFDGPSKTWRVPMASLGAVLSAFPGARLSQDLADERDDCLRAEDETRRAEAAVVAAAIAAYETDQHRQTLYAHQDAGVRWLIEHRTAILADDMGLGKTREALVAAKALGHHIIVVAPAGLRVNWLREAEAVDATIEVHSWAKAPPPPDCAYTLIADEAHYAQSLSSQRTKRFLELAKEAQAVYALTGTPLKNGRPANLWPLLVATRHPLAKDKGGYERRYCAAGPTRWSKWDVTGAAHLDELHRRICDGILRRMKSECLDLPEKTRVLKQVEMSAESAQRYRTTLAELQADYRTRKASGAIGAADALVLMNHLRHAGSMGKVDAAVEMSEEILEQGGQVVLFTAFLDSADALRSALGAERITGEDSAEARQSAIDRFQAGASKAIVCTLGAGNVGITLTAAQTVILVDRPWTPGDAIQAEDRLHRIGQRGSVLAVWLQANGADTAIDALLQGKHERIELVLSGKRKTLRGLGSMSDVAEAVLG